MEIKIKTAVRVRHNRLNYLCEIREREIILTEIGRTQQDTL